MAKGIYVGSTTGKKVVTNLMTESAFLNGGTYSNAGQWAGPTSSTQIPYTKGHKIYTRAKISFTGGNVIAGTRYWDNSNTFLGQHLSHVVNGYASVVGYNDNTAVTKMDFSIQNTATEVTTKIEYSECLWVDLTACFGTGNEPTKEWCDANIPFFTGETKVLHEQASPVARKVKSQYVGVANVARRVRKGYVGVANVARCFFSSVGMRFNRNTHNSASTWSISDDGFTLSWNLTGVTGGTSVLCFLLDEGFYIGNTVTISYDLTIDVTSASRAGIEFTCANGDLKNKGLAFYNYSDYTNRTMSGTVTFSSEIKSFALNVTSYSTYGSKGTISNLTINGTKVAFIG